MLIWLCLIIIIIIIIVIIVKILAQVAIIVLQVFQLLTRASSGQVMMTATTMSRIKRVMTMLFMIIVAKSSIDFGSHTQGPPPPLAPSLYVLYHFFYLLYISYHNILTLNTTHRDRHLVSHHHYEVCTLCKMIGPPIQVGLKHISKWQQNIDKHLHKYFLYISKPPSQRTLRWWCT